MRHGTTTLFAALNVFNGAVLAECKPHHRHQEFLAFLRSIDKAVPAELDVHCIVDNYGSHKHPKVKAWLAARPRWHLHFIPTYSSWLNQVDRFFSIITDKAIRPGSFTSVKELVNKIDHFVAHYNQNCKPFTWTASAASIVAQDLGASSFGRRSIGDLSSLRSPSGRSLARGLWRAAPSGLRCNEVPGRASRARGQVAGLT